MSDVAVKPKRAKLWREGWRSFYNSRNEWLKPAFCFFIVMIPVSYASLWEIGKYSIGNPQFLQMMMQSFYQLDHKIDKKAHPLKPPTGSHALQNLLQKNGANLQTPAPDTPDKAKDNDNDVPGSNDGNTATIKGSKGENIVITTTPPEGGKSDNTTVINVGDKNTVTVKGSKGEKIVITKNAAAGGDNDDGDDDKDADEAEAQKELMNNPLFQMMQDMKKGDSETRGIVALQWAGMGIGLFQMYIFFGLFLKREGVVPNWKPDVKGFCYYIGMLILWFLMIMGLVFLIILLCFLIGGLLALIIHFTPGDDKPKEILTAIMAFGMYFFCLGCMVYAGLRYGLVTLLAAGQIKSPIKNSSGLTHRNVFRMFLNYALVYIVFLLPFGVLSWALFIDFGSYGTNNIPMSIVMSVMFAALNVFLVLIISAFKAAICRVLYEEKRRADPAFVLVSDV